MKSLSKSDFRKSLKEMSILEVPEHARKMEKEVHSLVGVCLCVKHRLVCWSQVPGNGAGVGTKGEVGAERQNP